MVAFSTVAQDPPFLGLDSDDACRSHDPGWTRCTAATGSPPRQHALGGSAGRGSPFYYGTDSIAYALLCADYRRYWHHTFAYLADRSNRRIWCWYAAGHYRQRAWRCLATGGGTRPPTIFSPLSPAFTPLESKTE